MAKIYAVFDDEKALENATRSLGTDDYEILTPGADTGNPIAGPVAVANPAGMSTSNNITQAASALVTPLGQDVGAARDDEGDDSRVISEALRGGASVLVLRKADSGMAQRLRDLGASYVSA